MEHDALQNLGLILGFLNAVRLILRLKPRGLAWFGVPCNSFSYMPSSQHRRSWTTPYGNFAMPFVHQGNDTCTRSCLLILIGIVREVCFFIENPLGSTIHTWPYLNFLIHQPWLNGMRTSWLLSLSLFFLCVQYWLMILVLTYVYIYIYIIYIYKSS